MQPGPRIAVVSPTLDRRHGTERRVVELIEHLARDFGYEIHIYSQQLLDVSGVDPENFRVSYEETRNGKDAKDGSTGVPGRLIWHKLPKIPGPHLINYLWWFVTNHLWRWWDRRLRGVDYDLVYTPGINCLDADVASVHILFAEFYRQVRSQLRLRANCVAAWPRIIHRRIYYQLIIALEKLIYPNPRLHLAAISKKTNHDLSQVRRSGDVAVIYGGLDPSKFSARRRAELRPEARRVVGFSDSEFALLLIGNDWKNKGLDCLLAAMDRLRNPHLYLLVAGNDSVEPYRALIDRYDLGKQLVFLPIRPDVEFYYAAADAYVCPSLEDAFAFPPFEAMASGLPVITSSQAGVSELITDGIDGLLLQDPRSDESLARLIGNLYDDPALRSRLGQNGAKTASQYTWERYARQFHALFEQILCDKASVKATSKNTIRLSTRFLNPKPKINSQGSHQAP